ncbi:response regulator transcription factor [Paenibacillus oryzae]|nr:winged helix family transcriptional regulator [Paenibacillus oryzae]
MREEGTVTDFTEGVLCTLTKRVMLISPLPERVRSLLVTLSGQCFDVFSLHEFKKEMLGALQPELLVYDALPLPLPSVGHTLEGGSELLDFAVQADIPVLVLLDEQAYQDRSGNAPAGVELLAWPSDAREALRLINGMLEGRAASGASSEGVYTFKDIVLDSRKMTVLQSGTRIDLTKTEYDLLLTFLASDGSVFSRETLLDTVWGVQYYGGSNLVDVHIKSLRKKLRDSASNPQYIVTVRGAGYRLAD